MIRITDVLLDDNGNYVLAGLCHDSGDPPARALFARLHATGKIDTSFANDGYLLIQPQGADLNFLLERLVVQTNKRLLGIGYTSDEKEKPRHVEDGAFLYRMHAALKRQRPLTVRRGTHNEQTSVNCQTCQ